MHQLNLPPYNFKLKKEENKILIFDSQRKRYITLTPEEWVRQNFLRFLIEELNYPAALLAVEHQLELNGMKKRCDAILFNRKAEAIVIIEFKAPHIAISQSTFDQVAVYNSKLKVEYFIISNGLEHYCCRVDKKNARYEFLPSIPEFRYFLEQGL